MECVYRTPDRTIAQLLAGALASAGIPTLVQGEHLSSLQGELPAGASAEYRVCIVDPEQLPQATVVTREFVERRSSSSSGDAWVCPQCGERHEPQFLSCWKCGGDPDA